MAVMEAEHNDQFQIGDEVVYTPEGVITTVTGYDWLTSVEAPPKVLAYQLACGISAPKNLLAVYIGDRRSVNIVGADPQRLRDYVDFHRSRSPALKGVRSR
jgi:hypothetical protein